MEIVTFAIGLIVGAAAYHQLLKRKPETLQKMLDAIKKAGGSGDGP